jgi:Domain of unknown function (DUF1963)
VIGDFVSLGIAIVIVSAVAFGWLVVAHNLRVWRTRHLYRRLPPETRTKWLDQIDEAGRDNRACSLFVAQEANGESVSHDVTASRYGGDRPYAEAGDSWPRSEEGGGTPADFLIQVRLDSSFPPPWAGRLIVVFNKFDPDQTVRVYENPSADRFIALSGGPVPQREWPLRSVCIPKPQRHFTETETVPGEGDATGTRKTDASGGGEGETGSESGFLDYDPLVLFDGIPGLHDELARFTRRPADLLAILLAPNHDGYGFDISNIVQVGGRPVWLQADPGSPHCEQCRKPMRFLFQFGDLNGGVALGDAGVCYVFGCDEHATTASGTVQMC